MIFWPGSCVPIESSWPQNLKIKKSLHGTKSYGPFSFYHTPPLKLRSLYTAQLAVDVLTVVLVYSEAAVGCGQEAVGPARGEHPAILHLEGGLGILFKSLLSRAYREGGWWVRSRRNISRPGPRHWMTDSPHPSPIEEVKL